MGKNQFIRTNVMAIALVSSVFAAQANANSDKYKRTDPFTVDYSRGRTYQGAYSKDPGALWKLGRSLEQVCRPTKHFDFETGDFGPAFSKYYFSNPEFADFDVIVKISIPLQKMFVLDRGIYDGSGRVNGLIYAWRTSTGYHDKHYAYSRKEQKIIFGQKGYVQIEHRTREDALKKLRSIAENSGGQFTEAGGRVFVTFPNSPTKRVEYGVVTTKVNREKAVAQGLEILGNDPHSDRFVIVRRHVLNYHDYFHSEPGYYIVRNGFSSRHVSGESDTSLDTEVPYMPWAIFFNQKRGMATHAAAYRGTLGSTGSHGCVRLLEENACRLFHLVGQTPQASVSALNEKTGVKTGGTVQGHRALFIVSDELDPVEKRYLQLLLK